MAGRFRSDLEEAVNDLADVLEPIVRQLMADVFAFAEETLRAGQAVSANLAYLQAADPGPEPWTPDDAAVIPEAWTRGMEFRVVPTVNEAYQHGALTALGRQTPGPALPAAMETVLDRAGAEYLAAAHNRLVGIGDTAWKRARAELVTVQVEGGSIDDAAAALRRVLDVEQARAETIARTEMVGAANAGTLHGAQVGGFSFKQWLATLGPRTRPTHAAADGQVVAIDDTFAVGAAHLQHPGDPSGPAGEVINCRCTILLLTDAEALDLMGRETGGDVENPDRVLLVEEAAELKAVPTPAPEPAVERFPGGMTAKGANEWIRERWGVDGAGKRRAFFLDGLSKDAANDAAAAIQDLFTAFPNTAGRVRAIGANAPMTKAMNSIPGFRVKNMHPRAHADAINELGGIRISKARFASRAAYEAKLQADVDNGFHPTGTGSLAGIVRHEFGHHLYWEARTRDPGTIEAVHQVVRDHLPGLDGAEFARARYELIRSQVSEYALTNHDEMVAEAFMAVASDPDAASPFAHDIVAVVVKAAEQ